MKRKNASNKSDPKAAELDGKVQVVGQESASDVSNNVKVGAPDGGATIKEVELPKSAINTKKAAEVVSAGQSSIGAGIAMRRSGAITFSGGAGNIGTDVSATSKETGSYRSGGRTEKRADPITRKIDYFDAEIIKTKLYESKPLSETDKGQGYNGNYFNEHAITQRANGGAPGDVIFERSVDEIDIDMLYYTMGQVNKNKNYGNMSIRSWDATTNRYSSPTTFQIGNFLPRSLTIAVTSQGQISRFEFDETDYSYDYVDELTARAASDAFYRNMNLRELDRNIMISKAGNESDPSWSCLGDAVIDASDQARFIPMLDALAGDYVYTSIRKLHTSLSYALNKVAKDGSRVCGPMAEMLNGNIPVSGYGADGSVAEEHGVARCFDNVACANGGAGLWLAINDSLPKYNTKGKLLSLPLSFKSALSTALSNCAPLVMDDQLHILMEKNDLFSTIDGPYDPVKPVIITDKVGLISPISIFTGCSFASNTLHNTCYVQHYENMRNKYNIEINNFFIGGIFRWLDERALRIYDHFARNARNAGTTPADYYTITIPIVSSTTTISLWDLIVCSAVPYIVQERIKTLTEVLKYEKNFGYPYSGLIHLDQVNFTACDNFSYTSPENPISAGIAKPAAAIKVLLPEVFWPVRKEGGEDWKSGHQGVTAWVVLPHYFVQNQFKYDSSTTSSRKLLLSDDFATMAYPSCRSGNMMSFMDTLYGMDEEDYRLALDRMVVYPGYEGCGVCKFGRNDGKNSAYKNEAITYKYGLSTDGTPVLSYFAYATSSDNKDETLQVFDIIATPRELGLMQVAPAGVLTPIRTGASTLNTVASDSAFFALSGPGFRAKFYHAEGTTQAKAILKPGDTNFDNNASLRYIWDIAYATPYDATTFDNGMNLYGTRRLDSLTPFVTGGFCEDAGVYDPAQGTWSGGEAALSNNNLGDVGGLITVGSSQKYMWTRLQRLPFIVNPFDVNTADLTDNEDANINGYDIYDTLYMFGFCGFRASDYRELINLRIKERISKGMNYVVDPFVAKSILLK
jgi:hypothetical protein